MPLVGRAQALGKARESRSSKSFSIYFPSPNRAEQQLCASLPLRAQRCPRLQGAACRDRSEVSRQEAKPPQIHQEAEAL